MKHSRTIAASTAADAFSASSAPQPPPTEKAFYSSQVRRYIDADARRDREVALYRLLLIILTVAFALSGLGHGVQAWALAQKHDDVYAMVIDHNRYGKDAGVYSLPRVDESTDAAATAREAAVEYFLPLVVESQFGVDPDPAVVKRNLVRFVRPFVAPNSQAASLFSDYLSGVGDPVKRGQQVRVSVDVAPIPAPIAPNQYTVSWTTTTTDLDGSATCPVQLHCGKTTYSAKVGVVWGRQAPQLIAAPDGTTFGGNPAGMFVSQFQPDRSLDPSVVGTTGQ